MPFESGAETSTVPVAFDERVLGTADTFRAAAPQGAIPIGTVALDWSTALLAGEEDTTDIKSAGHHFSNALTVAWDKLAVRNESVTGHEATGTGLGSEGFCAST